MKLEQLLGSLGWSQAELGRRIDVHRNTVSKWFRDNNPPKVVLLYLELLIELRRVGE
jgi:transcriptional regulator with XRE-family HTH domain